jgi:excinuclease ABC subunit C
VADWENGDSLKEKVSKLPLLPGVYLMKDKTGKIIYIGKAKQLKNRVSSYFTSSHSHSRKTRRLVERICDFDYIVTPKEIDAFVLETSLIKQHNPKYNILLKDARGFNYVKITGEDYPRLLYVMDASDSSAEYIGPYVGGFFVRQSVEDANRIFMLPSCTRKLNSEYFGRSTHEKGCLNYRIKRCMGVCLGGVSKNEYAAIIRAAVDYIKNGSKASIKLLTKEMNTAAEKLEFEKAARIRDRIESMKRADTVRSVISSKTIDYDVVALSHDLGKVAVAVVKYSGGRLTDKESFYLGDEFEQSELQSALGDFLREYYSASVTLPSEICIENDIDDRELLQEFLKTKITVPKRGEGLAQIMLAKSNASELLALKTGRKSKETAMLEDFAKLIGLERPPEMIECYDISNIGESVKVGGMVVYRDGKPYKKAYRRFTIKEVDGLDDYACMREVIRRRFTGSVSEQMQVPELILLDGGKGHVSAVKEVLDELGISVSLFGLVKDSKHKTRGIAATGGEIEIQSNKAVFAFLTKLQEEVHRFSVAFAREKHRKSSFELTLTQVPRIGNAKAAMLLKHFKSKSALKSANADELREVAGIGEQKAQELYEFIQGKM